MKILGIIVFLSFAFFGCNQMRQCHHPILGDTYKNALEEDLAKIMKMDL